MKAYIINLLPAHKRRESVIAEFEKHQLPYELVYGIDNNQLRLFHPRVRLSTGAVGAFLSHRNVIQNSLQRNEDVFIVEDDIELGYDFKQRLDESLAHLPANWDIAFLGWFKSKNSTEVIIEEESKWFKVNRALGMHAYIVNKNSISKVLAQLNKVGDHVDKQLVRASELGKLNIYWHREKLVGLKPFPSQIAK